MGAAMGCDWLRSRLYPVLAIGGVLTRAPLQKREATSATRTPTLARAELSDPATAAKLADEARAHREAR